MKSLKDRIQEQANDATAMLNSMEMPKNPAVIFDIDDTLIDHHGIVIQPIVELYNHVKMLCIPIFIVTNRLNDANSVDYTKYELDMHGITEYTDIYFRKVGEKDLTKAKLDARKNIAEKGFDTIMSIGDQLWDLGEYGGIGILVPTRVWLW